ncbi:MAG: ABC transporter permease [Thermoplasmata archaeon]
MTFPEVPDFGQFRTAVKSQILSYVNTYRFWVIFGIVLAVGGGIDIAFTIKGAAWVQANFGPQAYGYVAAETSFLPFLAIVTGAFFGGDAISTDFGTKTGYYMLAQPVRRSILLTGRYVAALLVSAGVFAIFYLFTIYGGSAFYAFSSIPWANLALSYLFSILLILGILSFAFTLSATSRSPAIGLVVTIIILLVVFNIADGLVIRFAGSQYVVYSILYASGIISGVVAAGLPTTGPTIPVGIAIMVVYAVLFFVVAQALYHREET